MEYVSPHKQILPTIAAAIKNGESVPPVTVRTFLNWFFGTQRRGRWIVSYIKGELSKLGLRTVPDFESTYLGSEISFELALPASIGDATVRTDTADSVTVLDHTEVRVAMVTFDDPTYRISKLGAANRRPVSVKPDSSLTEAVTLMLASDFSQLPVMTNEREVKGAVSWKSIGSRLALGQTPQWVRDATEVHAEVGADASLFAAIRVIVEHGYALVRSADKRIAGIITTSDLSLQFEQLSEPFLLLGEIENHIRNIINSKFSSEDLSLAKDPTDRERSVEAASDLTFGEYKRLLETPTSWAKLNLNLDRGVFINHLDRVREIRNDVMHFDPDGIEDDDLEILRDFAKFLRVVQKVGATRPANKEGELIWPK